MYRQHTYCRACGLGKPSIPTLKHSTAAGQPQGEEKLIEVLDLGLSPLANDFVGPGEEHAGYAPLKLMWCPRCTLGQLSVVVDPKVLYRHYSYVTSHSNTMLAHFESITNDLTRECGCGSVVEIGSNDGTLLEYLQAKGFKTVLGIEPAENLADAALVKGINTENAFFSEALAGDIVSEIGHPDLVIARHVFCHIDDWQHAIDGLEMICGKDTVIAIEVPHFPDTVKKVEWDQIYGEHLSYLTIKALTFALEDSSLHIHRVIHYSIHGGAIMILLRRNDCGVRPHCCIGYGENLSLEDLRVFATKSKDQIANLSNAVMGAVRDGKTVVGYGASAKATQWITACGFTRKHLRFVCDNTPGKQYKTMPGTDIPVVDEGALTRELPDYAIMFCWNYEQECIEKEKIFREKGGKWIVPVPNLRIA